MKNRLGVIVCLIAVLIAAPATAITDGEPDEGEHPYVGQLIFYVPDAHDSRFDDPGAWYNCTGTLLTPTIVLTAGHCAFGIGADGTDVWVTFSEEADYEGLPPSSTYARDENDERYEDWSAFFDSHEEWISGTAYPHRSTRTPASSCTISALWSLMSLSNSPTTANSPPSAISTSSKPSPRTS